MFMGEYRHNIDAKGRMIIPARFRDELGNRFVVTRGLDGCLRTYTMAQWDAVFEQLKRLPSTKRETRMYIHMLTSKASECELDSQGRILLPAALITESGFVNLFVLVLFV
ncbi:division/cell wall cluster transcriptional repressor MraZ, partial [Holdemania filiformis]|uniref:division/cell wall cluster transcriptional repressor MraZ n=1 Tax=Holdemania filiformis TaxID=61171 RepID=UPI002432A351